MATKIMPISDLRRQISQVIESLRQESDVIYITRHGRPAAGLLDYAQYQSLLEHLRALARSKGAPLVREAGEKYQTGQPAGLLDSLAAMAEDLGIDDLAEQHDYYLYGTEKK